MTTITFNIPSVIAYYIIYSAPSINPMGVNKEAGGSGTYSTEAFPIFKNMVRWGRGFTIIGNTEVQVPLYANGQPSTDFALTLYEGNNQSQGWAPANGIWYCGFQGSGYEVITETGSGVLGNVVTNTTGGYTTFTIFAPSQGVGPSLSISNTTGGVANMFCYLPGYGAAMGNTIDNPTQASAYTTEAINFYKQFSHIRWMDPSNAVYNTQMGTAANRRSANNTQAHQGWNNQGVSWTGQLSIGATSGTLTAPWAQPTGTYGLVLNDGGGPARICSCNNGNTIVTWSASAPLAAATTSTSSFFGMEGFPLDWAVGFSNAAGVDLWINTPILEDNPNYFAGSWSNATFAYINTHLNWAAGRKLYIEVSDEIWNLVSASVAAEMAALYTGANFTGDRMHQLANCAANAFGSLYGTQAFVGFPWQAGRDGNGFYVTQGVINYYTSIGVVPKNIFQFLGNAPYINTSGLNYAQFDATTANNVLNVTSILSGTINVGYQLWNANVISGTTILSQTTGNSTGALGNTGNYIISANQNLSTSQEMNTSPTVAQIEANLLPIAANQFMTAGCESLSILAMHWGMDVFGYEGGFQGNSENAKNINAANVIMDNGMQQVMSTYYAGLFPAFSKASHFTSGVYGETPPFGGFLDELSNNWQTLITVGSPTYNAMAQYIPGTYVTPRNLINGPGSFIPGNSFADYAYAGNAVLSGGYSSNSSPYYAGSGYKGWVVYCTVANTYNLIINANTTGITNVETGNTQNGFVINYTGVSLAAGNTTVGSIYIPPGRSYILLGANTNQNLMINGMWIEA